MVKRVPRLDGGITRRDSTANYNRLWRKLRLHILADQPICRVCDDALSVHVDHIDGDSSNHEWSNLQGICPPCHQRKTTENTRIYGHG